MSAESNRSWLIALFLAAANCSVARGEPGDFVEFIPFHTVAPQDIAMDADGTFWITAFLDNKICHYDASLKTSLGQIPYPVSGTYPTGIAYNSTADTLLVTDALSSRIIEIGKDGVPTGLSIAPSFDPRSTAPFLRGMAYNPHGDFGNGSIVFVEVSGALIYEITLDGRTINKLPHPDTPVGTSGQAPPPRSPTST